MELDGFSQLKEPTGGCPLRFCFQISTSGQVSYRRRSDGGVIENLWTSVASTYDRQINTPTLFYSNILVILYCSSHPKFVFPVWVSFVIGRVALSLVGEVLLPVVACGLAIEGEVDVPAGFTG